MDPALRKNVEKHLKGYASVPMDMSNQTSGLRKSAISALAKHTAAAGGGLTNNYFVYNNTFEGGSGLIKVDFKASGGDAATLSLGGSFKAKSDLQKLA